MPEGLIEKRLVPGPYLPEDPSKKKARPRALLVRRAKRYFDNLLKEMNGKKT